MKNSEIVIEGMSCNHCIMAVRKELGKISGLEIVDVQTGSAKVKYNEDEVPANKLKDAVEEAGFVFVHEKGI